MSAVLRAWLKIADLTAWTALEAGRSLLPDGYGLTRVTREDLYLFEPAPGSAAEGFEEPLQHAVANSNFFVNPNKEQARFLKASQRGPTLAPPDGAWGILVRGRQESLEEGLRERLLREHPMEGLGAIRRGRLWWLWTRAPDGSRGVERCWEGLGPVRGTRQGLLVNPHAEEALRIDAPVPWATIERFLGAETGAGARSRTVAQ